MGKPRRSFTREFKVEAVKLVTEQLGKMGLGLEQACSDLWIS